MFKIEEAKACQAVAKLLRDVDVVVEELKFAVFLHAADFQLVVKRAVQPHFAMCFGDIVVDIGVEIFDIFGRPAADQFAFGVFAPTDADAGGDGLVLVAVGARCRP